MAKEGTTSRKAVKKSDNITGTPARGKMMEVMPNTKKASKREQDKAKKLRQDKKNDLLKYFADGACVLAPMSKGTPIDAVTQRRESRGTGNNTPNVAGSKEGGKKKSGTKKASKSTLNKANESDNGDSKGNKTCKTKTPQAGRKGGGFKVNLDSMNKIPLKEKGKKRDGAKKKKKEKPVEEDDGGAKTLKKATFAETVKNEATKAQRIKYKKCVARFAIRVDKGNNTKGGCDKKLTESLTFMQTYINKHASFHPIGKDQTAKPIEEKTDMPKYQVTMRSYFGIPNPRAFDNVSQDGGRVIKGSAVMGFSTDPQTCLDDAAGDLGMMVCAIYYKKCQEVDTVATQVLVGAPNTIEEDIIKQTMDEELKIWEKNCCLRTKTTSQPGANQRNGSCMW
jgi:hypothetical protein